MALHKDGWFWFPWFWLKGKARCGDARAPLLLRIPQICLELENSYFYTLKNRTHAYHQSPFEKHRPIQDR